ncbi:glycosyltransferase [Candidatus Woesearchaeota archaeon]|nr:glycosyltransferase [Candidatus Woesearchaeota archaeon]
MKVSAVVCPLNQEKFIKRCIDSILPQVDEVIVVDASSDDRTLEIIDKRYKKNSNISVYIIPRKEPLAYARNYGAKRAKHELILFADSDIILNKNWINIAKKTLIKENLASVGGRTRVEGNTFNKRFLRILRDKETFDSCPYPSRVILMRKGIFNELNGFNVKNKMGEDEELYKRVLKKGYKSRNILTIYETHLGEPDSFSRVLKRQAKYGRFSYLERNPAYSLSNILLSLLMISPLSILYSLRLYYYIFKNKLEGTKNILFLFILPLMSYLFYAVYFYNNLVAMITKNRNVKWHELKW